MWQLKKDFEESTLTKIKHSVSCEVDNETQKTSVEVPSKLPAGATQTELLNFPMTLHCSARVTSPIHVKS
jgi:hypothetical protein